jgi:hypothetical protein
MLLFRDQFNKFDDGSPLFLSLFVSLQLYVLAYAVIMQNYVGHFLHHLIHPGYVGSTMRYALLDLVSESNKRTNLVSFAAIPGQPSGLYVVVYVMNGSDKSIV